MIEDDAATFIVKYEGFTPKAVWDVKAWRIGHGSGTVTFSDGTFRNAQQGDTTTKDLAKIDLARRVKAEYIPKVQLKIGIDAWNALPIAAQVALVDLAYNYGNITHKAIVTAAQTGDPAKLAKAIVTATANDNAKLDASIRAVLKKRRKDEADYITNASQNARQAAKTGGSLSFFGFIIYALLLGGIIWAIYYFFFRA